MEVGGEGAVGKGLQAFQGPGVRSHGNDRVNRLARRQICCPVWKEQRSDPGLFRCVAVARARASDARGKKQNESRISTGESCNRLLECCEAFPRAQHSCGRRRGKGRLASELDALCTPYLCP